MTLRTGVAPGPAGARPGAALSSAFALLLLWAAASLALAPLAAAAAPPSPFVEELKSLHADYHTNPARLDVVRQGLEDAVKANPRIENLLALAQVSWIWGDIRATTREQKLEAYTRGREAAQRAMELDPNNALPHFWFGTNGGRLGQTRGMLKSLFALPALKESIRSALELDPHLTAAYALAGYVYYEVPGIFGGDLRVAEDMFRKGLSQDPKFTGMRIGLAKTLIRKGRIAEARRELRAVLEEKNPSNLAEWTLKDSKEARELLESIQDHP